MLETFFTLFHVSVLKVQLAAFVSKNTLKGSPLQALQLKLKKPLFSTGIDVH